ncbi:MAG TPA: bestrophin family ion channel [Enterovirga sp.]|nr:bestrophin family ion channel [Enterovirga sp.]
MIVRDRPSGLRLFFVVRGSIVPKIAPQIFATMLVALVVAYFHGVFFTKDLTFTATPFTIMGLALSIFLGFRNGAAYDRFWEGRRLWGDLLIASRTLSRQVLTLIREPGAPASAPTARQRQMIYKAIAFAHALRHLLRGTDPAPDLAPLLDPADLRLVLASVNPPQALLRSLGRDLGEAITRGAVPDQLAASVDTTLDNMDRVLAGCERLRSTPIPFSYTLLLHRTAYLYCFLLPFGLVDTVGMATPIVVGLVSYTFFGLDALGDEIEEPFGTLPNDLPLAAISRTIEINLREALGEPDLPRPLEPVDYCLL